MKDLKKILYVIITILLIYGIVKIILIENSKSETIYTSDGIAYHKNNNIDYTYGGQLVQGDGQSKQNKEILSIALTFGGLISGLLLLTTLLKTKVENTENLKSRMMTGKDSENHSVEKEPEKKPIKALNINIENGIQYQKLAENAQGCYLLLQDVKTAISSGNNQPDHLLYSCYLMRNEILDRIEKYNWSLNTPIIVPMIPGQNKTLNIVLNILNQNINTCAKNISYNEECQEILNREEFYYEFESRIPPQAKERL